MAELRYHPLIRDWVMIAGHRQGRPQMPKDWCPFCPGSGRVPDDFDVLMYPNDFPALSQAPPSPDDVSAALYPVRPAYGKCEVVLYSPKHTATLPELSTDHIRKLVDLWAERTDAMAADPQIKYVFIFENRGREVGVTMPHPHGQIYGYSWIPKKIELELESCRIHHAEQGRCLLCDMLQTEKEDGRRIIFENDHFVVFLPFFSEYPYGVYVLSKTHEGDIRRFTDEQRNALASTLKDTVGMLDALYQKPFPYMMCLHQNPVNGEDASEYYHFHIEFFPPLRSENVIKYNASSETGAWAHCNPTAPEEKAEELRSALQRYRALATE